MERLFIINLQLFASEEKTEKPTPKKRKEAREKGQVVQSREVNSALILLFAIIGLKIFGGYMYNNLINFTKSMFTYYEENEVIFNINGIHKLLLETVLITAKVVAPIVAITFVIGLTSTYMQVGFLFTTKTLGIKLNRINPVEGFKRMFSKRALVELLKSLIKVTIIGYVIYSFILSEVSGLINLFELSIQSIVKNIAELTFEVGIRTAIILIAFSILDYWYQRWDNEKNLMMSKKEVKDEYKQTEGDPQIKSKVKEKQRQLAMSRMMQEVPKADVIITNPTHYAVALKYDSSLYDAPYVVAKGKDLIAQNIKKIGNDSSVPIVENKPLAQALYNNVEVGQVIPEDLYQAVAEVLAYVYSLQY
jgi:flagellar biosynthetic protein FlhB